MKIKNFKKWIEIDNTMILKNHIESFNMIFPDDDTCDLYLSMRSGKINCFLKLSDEELSAFYEYMRIDE